MSCTLATAAKATGLNKSTILRAIKIGQITGTKDQFGEWRVEPVEFHRVHPAVPERQGGILESGRAKLRTKVVAGRRPPKFNVTIAGTEWLAAEHAADRAAVHEIPAAREHCNLSTE
jgi:hypothetical protein